MVSNTPIEQSTTLSQRLSIGRRKGHACHDPIDFLLWKIKQKLHTVRGLTPDQKAHHLHV